MAGARERASVSPPRAKRGRAEPARLDPRGAARFADLDDATLAGRCRRGDAHAWEAIVLRYRRLVYAIPTRCGLAPEEADEVFQCTFARLVERLATIRDPGLIRAWLVTTAKRLSLDSIRRRRAVEMSEEILGNMPDSAPLPGEELARIEDQHLVRQAFERLPERCRALLGLLYYAADEPSYEAIGKQLGMPLGSIGPTRARCLEKLVKLYEELTGKE